MEGAQTQVDGCGIKRINRLFQLHREAVVGVKLSDNLDQAHREIHVGTATLLIRICQRILGDACCFVCPNDRTWFGQYADRFLYRVSSRDKLVARKSRKEIDRDTKKS